MNATNRLEAVDANAGDVVMTVGGRYPSADHIAAMATKLTDTVLCTADRLCGYPRTGRADVIRQSATNAGAIYILVTKGGDTLLCLIYLATAGHGTAPTHCPTVGHTAGRDSGQTGSI